MTSEQRSFLNRRFRDAVAPPTPDQDIPMLLEQGFVTSGPIMPKVMKTSSCHQNIAAIWTKRKYGIIGIATGYALSDDGLWRQHSWGILRAGIVETAQTRVKYFGIVFQGEKADFFAFSNSDC